MRTVNQLEQDYAMLMQQYRWLVSLYITNPTWLLYDEWKASHNRNRHKLQSATRCRARCTVMMDRVQTKRDPVTGEWCDMLTSEDWAMRS